MYAVYSALVSAGYILLKGISADVVPLAGSIRCVVCCIDVDFGGSKVLIAPRTTGVLQGYNLHLFAQVEIKAVVLAGRSVGRGPCRVEVRLHVTVK